MSAPCALRVARRLHAHLQRTVATRTPDFVVGAEAEGGPYLRRWYITPWRGWYRNVPEHARTRWQRFAIRVARWLPNLYLHEFLRDDDDRALHDHPSWALSFILRGAYREHTIDAGGIHRRRWFLPGSLRFLGTRHAHRIELLRDIRTIEANGEVAYDSAVDTSTWTLFLFGPTVREWGFHCPERGWVHWKRFTAAGKPGEVGRGCDV